MKQPDRKPRKDLTEDEKARLEKYGSVEFKSSRPAWDPGSVKFIPSQAQH